MAITRHSRSSAQPNRTRSKAQYLSEPPKKTAQYGTERKIRPHSSQMTLTEATPRHCLPFLPLTGQQIRRIPVFVTNPFFPLENNIGTSGFRCPHIGRSLIYDSVRLLDRVSIKTKEC